MCQGTMSWVYVSWYNEKAVDTRIEGDEDAQDALSW